MPVEVMVALLRILAAISAVAVLWPHLLRPGPRTQKLFSDCRAGAARDNRNEDS